jgi:sec-independent protein translocase protein TatA
MLNVGPAELIVIFLVALLVVGPKRLPQLGRTIGKSLREFRRATDDFKQSFEFGVDDDDFPDETADGHGVVTPTETPAPTPRAEPAATDPEPKPDDPVR